MKLSLVLISILLSVTATAGETLTLDQAVEEVLGSNQDVRAAGYRVEAARARIPQAKALDDPSVGVEFYNVPISTADVGKADDIDYSIEQKIPFPGKRHVRGNASRFDAEAVAANSGGRVQDVVLDVKRTYYDLYRVDRDLEVNHETQGLLRLFLGSVTTAYASNLTTADAPLKAQVELSKLKNEEILLRQERQTHQAHMKALLNRPSHEDGDLRLPTRLHWPRLASSLNDIVALSVDARPELAELRAMEKRDAAKVTVAKQNLIPDLTVGFTYKQKPIGEDVWSASTMINLPIFWGKHRGEIQEAKASLKATQAEHQSMEIHTHHEIEQAYSGVVAAQKVVASYQREILPQAHTTLEAARTAYASGKVDFLTLIDAARTYKDLQTSYYDNQARLGQTFAELERLAGRDLKEGEQK